MKKSNVIGLFLLGIFLFSAISVSAISNYEETFDLSQPIVSDFSTLQPFNKLIGFWGFDGDTDSNAYDFSLSNFLGSYSGNPLSLTGLFYRSLNLDGNDYVTITNDLKSEDFTICSWIKPENMDADSFVWDTTGNAFSMEIESDGDLIFQIYNEEETYHYLNIRVTDDDESSIAEGVWTHVCFSYDEQNGNMSYYEDSVLRKSVAFSDEVYTTSNIKAFNVTALSEYHLQGVDTDGVDKMWWSFTDKLIVSNMTDNTEILNISTDLHEGDIAVCNGSLFVPWTDGSFVEGAYTTMRVYNATNLTLIEEQNISEHINFGAGGVTCDGENLYVVESCGAASPNRYQDNYVYVFNQSNVSQFIEKHKIEVPGDHIWYCTQTIAKHGDDFLLGGYDNDYELIKLNSTFDFVENYGDTYAVSTGIASWNSTHIITTYGSGTSHEGYGGFYSLESGAREVSDITNLKIGSDISGLNNFNGSIDEVMLFKKTLNATEISNLYNNISTIYSSESYLKGDFFNITEGAKYVNISLSNYNFQDDSNVSVSVGKWSSSLGYKDNFNTSKGFIDKDGTNGNYIKVSDDDRLDVGTGDFSIFAWIKTNMTGVAQHILDKEGIDPRFYFRVTSANKLQLILDDGVTLVDSLYSLTTIPTDEWVHIGVVIDRDSNATFYLNGVSDGVGLDDVTVLGTLDNNNDITIGSRYSSVSAFNGSIDEVMLFKKAVNSTQVSEIYNLSRGGDFYDNKLAAWWRFENNTEDSISDNDGSIFGNVNLETDYTNNLKAHWSADDHANDTFGINNGTLSGGASYSTGKYGSAFEFDGVEGKVTFADDDSLDVGVEDFAISVWVNSLNVGTYGMIVNKEGTDPRWYVRLNTNGQVGVALDDGSNELFDMCSSGSENLVGTGWRNIIINADRDGLLSCYVDNVLYGTPADISSIGNLSNANDFLIGQRYSNAYPFNGSIDDVMIFNSTLSSLERKEIYENGLLNINQTDYYNISSGSSGYIEIENDTTYIQPIFKLQTDSARFSSPLVYDSLTLALSSDIGTPIVTLVSPVEGYSETTSSATIDFLFNASDVSNDVDYCAIFLNDVKYANTSVISEIETNNISISSIAAGSYSWKVFCNDSIGNEINSSSRNFTITAPTEEEETTPQGGGDTGGNSCSPIWDCGSWSFCNSGLQSRTCSKLNSCSSNSNKPDTEKTCSVMGSLIEKIGSPVVNPIIQRLNCGAKPAVGEWGSCNSNDVTTRINYECTLETNYEWLSYSQEKLCSTDKGMLSSVGDFFTKSIPDFFKGVWDFISFWN